MRQMFGAMRRGGNERKGNYNCGFGFLAKIWTKLCSQCKNLNIFGSNYKNKIIYTSV